MRATWWTLPSERMASGTGGMTASSTPDTGPATTTRAPSPAAARSSATDAMIERKAVPSSIGRRPGSLQATMIGPAPTASGSRRTSSRASQLPPV